VGEACHRAEKPLSSVRLNRPMSFPPAISRKRGRVNWFSQAELKFPVAPATLVFHGVTDAKIDIDWGRSGFQAALHPVSIDQLERERMQNQKVYLDRPYYSWRMCLNWRDGGLITFGAVGFTQTLRAEPILTEN
jgi:hypothetical protein